MTKHRIPALRLMLLPLALAAAACTDGQAPVAFDVGNMAYPTPLSQGNVAVTTVSDRRPTDTGNMAYPTPLPQGTIAVTPVSERRPFDTGNMAYPTPTPQGVVATIVTR